MIIKTTFVGKKERLDDISRIANKILLTQKTKEFVDSATNFIANYLPLEKNHIRNVLLVSFQKVEHTHNIKLDELISNRAIKSDDLKIILTKEYNSVLDNQDPIVDLCVDGLLKQKFFN